MTVITARQFSVDEIGAYVTELLDRDGRPVLFSRTMIGEKLRGGSHVCYPYFGPDASGVLPQHGFGRTATWQTHVSDDNRKVTCTYNETEDELFAGLRAILHYEISAAGDAFTTTLAVTNTGDTSRVVMPGFHPYIAIDPADVTLNGVSIEVADFEPFQSFPDMSRMTVETAGRTVTISSTDLTYMVAWTDSKGDYLCVEPTLQGNGFDSTATAPGTIAPGATVSYSFTIAW